jgi:hypothetical protein
MNYGRSGIFAIFVQCIEDADQALGYLAEDLRGELRVARQLSSDKHEISGLAHPQPPQSMYKGSEEVDFFPSGSEEIVSRPVAQTHNEDIHSIPSKQAVLDEQPHINQQNPNVEEGAPEPAVLSCFQQKPSEKDLDNISKEVGGDWKSLLVQLGVPYATIEQLLQKHFGDPSAACLNGLVLWRNGSEKYCPPTWSSLLKALRGAEKVELAQELERGLLKDTGHHPQGFADQPGSTSSQQVTDQPLVPAVHPSNIQLSIEGQQMLRRLADMNNKIEIMKFKGELVCSFKSEGLLTEDAALNACGTSLSETWMRDLLIVVLKSNASFEGDKELWCDLVWRVGQVFEKHVGDSVFAKILIISVSCDLPHLLIQEVTFPGLCSTVLSTVEGPKRAEQTFLVADMMERYGEVDCARNLRFLCMMREQGILPDDTAYFLSGEFDFGVNSHHTTASLSCLKNKLTLEMFEKCIELSSKYAVHGLCAISKVIYSILKEVGSIKELETFFKLVPYVPNLAATLLQVFESGRHTLRVAEMYIECGLEVANGQNAFKGIMKLSEKGLLSKKEAASNLHQFSQNPVNVLPASVYRPLASHPPPDISAAVKILKEELGDSRQANCLAAVGELKAAMILKEEDVSDVIPCWFNEADVEDRIIRSLSTKVPFLPEAVKILERNNLMKYLGQLRILRDLTNILTMEEQCQLLAEIAPERERLSSAMWITLLRQFQRTKSDEEKRWIDAVLKSNEV